MGTLISNGSSLYRYGGSLLRTPITVTLRPKAYWNSPAGETETLISGFSQITGAHRSYTGSSDIYDANIDSQLEEVYAMRSVPSYGWFTTVQDMGACWYGGGFSTTDPKISYQGYNINRIARAFGAHGCYRFTIPNGLEKLTLTGLSCTYSGSVAMSFGSTTNNQFSKSSNEFQFCGFINSTNQIAPNTLMNKLKNEGYELNFMASSGSSLGVFDFWLFSTNIKNTGRDGTIPVAWMSGSADVTNAAIQSVQSIMNAGGNDFYLHIIIPFDITSSNFQPSYKSSTPVWWQAQIVNNPVIRATFE